MVKDRRCEGIKDGLALYVKLDTLIEHFLAEGNAPMASAMQRLKVAFLAEARGRLKSAPPTEVGEVPRGFLLRAAREHAHLTHAALAAKLALPLDEVVAAESNRKSVAPAFVRRVLKACNLPADWLPTGTARDVA